MSVIVLPPDQQKVARGVLVGAALSQGLSGVAQSLFAIAQQRAQREQEDKRLAQQLDVAKDRMTLSEKRMNDLSTWRSNMLQMQQQGLINTQESRQMRLDLDREKLDAQREHQSVMEGIAGLHANIAEANLNERRANRGAAASKAPKLNEDQMLTEDRARAARGLNPKYHKGASAADLDTLWKKRTAVSAGNPLNQALGGIISGAVGGGAAAPPAALPSAAPPPPGIQVPDGWNVQVVP